MKELLNRIPSTPGSILSELGAIRRSGIREIRLYAAGTAKFFDWPKSAVQIIARSSPNFVRSNGRRCRRTRSLNFTRGYGGRDRSRRGKDPFRRNNLSNCDVRSNEVHANGYRNFHPHIHTHTHDRSSRNTDLNECKAIKCNRSSMYCIT